MTGSLRCIAKLNRTLYINCNFKMGKKREKGNMKLYLTEGLVINTEGMTEKLPAF